MFARLVYCPATDAEQARRGRWLNTFLLSITAISVLFIASVTPLLTSWPRAVIGKLILLVLALILLYLINRRGFVRVASGGVILTGLVLLTLLSLDPKTGILTSLFVPIFFVLLLIIAGVFVSWRTVPFLVILLTLITVWLYHQAIPDLPYRTTAPITLWVVTFCVGALFVAVGALSWLSSRMIRETLDDLRHRNLELEAANRDLLAQSQQERRLGTNINELAAQLAAMSARQGNGMATQARSILQVASAVADLHAAADQIALTADEVRTATDAALAAVQQTQEMVLHSREAVARNRAQVQQVIERITALEGLTERISAFVTSIRDLSEETQLLALNATIEAAGAGPLGRRFGVVASEVQNLAHRANGTVDQIRALIVQLQGAGQVTLAATQGSIAVANEVEGLTDAVREAQEQVVAAVERASALVALIAQETHRQTTATEQVTTTMQEIAQVSDATSRDSSDLDHAIGELTHTAALLNSALTRLRSPLLTY